MDPGPENTSFVMSYGVLTLDGAKTLTEANLSAFNTSGSLTAVRHYIIYSILTAERIITTHQMFNLSLLAGQLK